MIDEEKTLQMFGYSTDTHNLCSNDKICQVCDECGKETIMEYCNYARKVYSDLCRGCSIKKGYIDNPERRKQMSASTKKSHADDPTLRDRLSISQKKSFADDPGRAERKSAAQQGISYEEWEGFATGEQYCEKFDEACRENNRNKYGNRCFICDIPESDNITKSGKQIALSVHHYDMNKMNGCDDTDWRLVPVCMHCHGIVHTLVWQARIEYLLKYVVLIKVGSR